MQFVINELPLLLLCPIGLIYAGMDGLPLTHLILALTLILSLILLYRFIYLKRMTYSVGNEQFVFEYGVFHRKVDFNEHQTFIQQLCGLKTVSIYSGDRTTPRLDIIGVKNGCEYVSLIRERVEYNKRRKGIYEITNR